MIYDETCMLSYCDWRGILKQYHKSLGSYLILSTTADHRLDWLAALLKFSGFPSKFLTLLQGSALFSFAHFCHR